MLKHHAVRVRAMCTHQKSTSQMSILKRTPHICPHSMTCKPKSLGRAKHIHSPSSDTSASHKKNKFTRKCEPDTVSHRSTPHSGCNQSAGIPKSVRPMSWQPCTQANKLRAVSAVIKRGFTSRPTLAQLNKKLATASRTNFHLSSCHH